MREEAFDRIDPTAAWRALCDELDRWGEQGQTASLWWRDDDAVAPTPQLDRLLSLADDVPVAVAVIPAAAEESLSQALSGVRVLQHGWSHRNHGGDGKKSEFPGGRDAAAVAAELAGGRERLRALFGERALPVLAPPWNRFDARFLPLLREAGLHALSRQGARHAASPEPGIAEVNVHADLIDWHGGRGFAGAPAVLGMLERHLRARREGSADREEPTGILTHHLIQDRAAESFLSELLALTRRHPAARWLDAAEVFGSA
jgi:peptidoglycan/xylan/chitin deacetylase (PgdA/CDA1 family)